MVSWFSNIMSLLRLSSFPLFNTIYSILVNSKLHSDVFTRQTDSVHQWFHISLSFSKQSEIIHIQLVVGVCFTFEHISWCSPSQYEGEWYHYYNKEKRQEAIALKNAFSDVDFFLVDSHCILEWSSISSYCLSSYALSFHLPFTFLDVYESMCE